MVLIIIRKGEQDLRATYRGGNFLNTNFESELHRKMAIELFNSTWELMEKMDRSEIENDTMVHAAHASRFHWGVVGTPTHFARGEWQISRVYTLVDRPEAALVHANKSLALCLDNQISDFDTGFAYEALTRAYAGKGDKANVRKNLELSRLYAERVKKQSERKWLLDNICEIEAKIEND